METLYQKTRIISRVKKHFMPYIELLTKPTGHKLFLLLLAILSMQAVTSIQHIYNWFLRGMSKISLNAYYYLLTYTELPIDKFAAVTLGKGTGSSYQPLLMKIYTLCFLTMKILLSMILRGFLGSYLCISTFCVGILRFYSTNSKLFGLSAIICSEAKTAFRILSISFLFPMLLLN